MTTKRFSISKISDFIKNYMISMFYVFNPHELVKKDPELADMMETFKKSFNNMISLD
jgi:hypothetical protein